MLRAVLDANVFVSATINPHGSPAKVIAALDSFDLVISEAILAEIGQVLLYPRIVKRHGWTAEEVRAFLEHLAHLAIQTSGKVKLRVIPDDPADDRYVEAAVEGDADYLVSGDFHLLKLKEYCDVRIVTPKEFLRVLGDAPVRLEVE